MNKRNSQLDQQGKIWLRAREVIAKSLAEMYAHGAMAVRERHRAEAAAIIHRLASSEPPLLICTAEEMKP